MMYGRIIGYPELKPHDLRHGVAMEVLEQHHDLEQVRALLGHARIDTTQIYTSIRPPQLNGALGYFTVLERYGCDSWLRNLQFAASAAMAAAASTGG